MACPSSSHATRHHFRKGALLVGFGLACIMLERPLGAYLDDDMAASLLILICVGLGIGLTHPMIAK